MRFIAVVSCKLGLAESHRVCSELTHACKAANHEMSLEVHGASGFAAVAPSEIAAAQGVLLVADQPVPSLARFAALPLVHLSPRAVALDARSALAALEHLTHR